MPDQSNTQPPENNTEPPKPAQPPAEAKTPDSPKPETSKSEPAEHMIPKSRFDELNAKLKEANETLEAIRKTEAEAKKATELAQTKAAEEQGKWKELYEGSLTKLEEIQQAKADAEAKAKAAEIAALRTQIAAEVGLPAKLALRLQGETDEEIRADAEAILELMPGTPAPPMNTDGSRGNGGKGPGKPPKTDAEIREEAARLGVGYEALKQHYDSLQI